MKISKLFLLVALFSVSRVYSQALDPVITFNEDPVSYIMHICSDGKYYYTINGGVPESGKISVYNLKGEFIANYPIKLDMRSIMYNKKDKSLYINTKNREIYKVLDIASGTIQLLYSGIYDNEQSSLAIDPKGKYMYALDNGSLTILDIKKGAAVKKLSGFKCGNKGMKGSTTVAVDKNYIYTWDADIRTLYVYNLEGVFKTSFVLKNGNMGHTLSYANGMIMVANSEKGKTGTWFGYKLPL